ncbi:hypothetical protein MNV49_005916 [Pseudohyphozyma bogoriensis]|nr:hypothetical protein MNV49_005916 [Pseudohyphozyma bogoriensis]
MGSDWDASDSDSGAAAAPSKPVAAPVVASKKGKFADEDVSDEDVKDDWDASDDEEVKKPVAKPAGPAPPIRQKGITKQKIAEREAAEAARAKELAARSADSPQERKARERAAMLKADMDNAAALFGGVSVGDDPLTMVCQNKDDFEAFSTQLASRIIASHGQHPLYALFLEQFAKALAQPLKDIEVKKVASGLTTLANEKQKAAKEATQKGKKGKKPALGLGKAPVEADTRAYEEVLDDDYDDFM